MMSIENDSVTYEQPEDLFDDKHKFEDNFLCNTQ